MTSRTKKGRKRGRENAGTEALRGVAELGSLTLPKKLAEAMKAAEDAQGRHDGAAALLTDATDAVEPAELDRLTEDQRAAKGKALSLSLMKGDAVAEAVENVSKARRLVAAVADETTEAQRAVNNRIKEFGPALFAEAWANVFADYDGDSIAEANIAEAKRAVLRGYGVTLYPLMYAGTREWKNDRTRGDVSDMIADPETTVLPIPSEVWADIMAKETGTAFGQKFTADAQAAEFNKGQRQDDR